MVGERSLGAGEGHRGGHTYFSQDSECPQGLGSLDEEESPGLGALRCGGLQGRFPCCVAPQRDLRSRPSGALSGYAAGVRERRAPSVLSAAGFWPPDQGVLSAQGPAPAKSRRAGSWRCCFKGAPCQDSEPQGSG